MLLAAQLCALDFPHAAVKVEKYFLLMYFAYSSHSQLFVCINMRLINAITSFVCALLFVIVVAIFIHSYIFWLKCDYMAITCCGE